MWEGENLGRMRGIPGWQDGRMTGWEDFRAVLVVSLWLVMLIPTNVPRYRIPKPWKAGRGELMDLRCIALHATFVSSYLGMMRSMHTMVYSVGTKSRLESVEMGQKLPLW
jgi:hypothetical protein